MLCGWSVRQVSRSQPAKRRSGPALTQDDGVGGKNGKVGVEFVEEVKLVGLAADAVGKQEHVAFQPRNGLRRVFETNAGTAHDECLRMDQLGWYVVWDGIYEERRQPTME